MHVMYACMPELGKMEMVEDGVHNMVVCGLKEYSLQAGNINGDGFKFNDEET